MTVPYSSGAFQFDGRELAGRSMAPLVANARAHPHMPRRRKSIRPARASGGNASPRADLRSVSYCVTAMDNSAELLFASVIAVFFSRPPPAQSSWDGCGRRISDEPVLQARAPVRARPRCVAVLRMPKHPPAAYGDRVDRVFAVLTRPRRLW